MLHIVVQALVSEGVGVSQQTRDIHPMLDQRRRRWANIVPTLGECLVFAGIVLHIYTHIHIYTHTFSYFSSELCFSYIDILFCFGIAMCILSVISMSLVISTTTMIPVQYNTTNSMSHTSYLAKGHRRPSVKRQNDWCLAQFAFWKLKRYLFINTTDQVWMKMQRRK